MKSFKIGIAIPNYNNGKYLRECIESILCQSYTNTEILVVDDCSTDDSIEILEEISSQQSNVSYIINEKNMGVSYTRNRGLKELQTDYLTSIDADDFYYSNKKLENEMKLILKYKEQGHDVIAYSNIVSTNIDGMFQKRNINSLNLCNGNCFEKFITREARIPTCSVFSKLLYQKVGGFDPKIKLYEDWDFELRLSKVAQFYYTYEDGFAYRHHSFGLSSSKKEELKYWLNYVFEKNIELVDKQKQLMLRKRFNNTINPSLIRKVVRKLKRIAVR
jgi:glycosyltransferase involved in cell wall biosynthesis